MPQTVSIGNASFESIRRENCFYIDKTSFIREWWEKKDVATLIMRPRRFGKTLNLSMIKYYFEKTFDQDGKEENNSYLFDGLNIMASGEAYTSHLGQYPVISLSLKSAKQPDFPRAYAMLKRQIANDFAVVGTL